MGRYRGGRGGGSGALIQIVVYIVIHIIEAIIKAIANRSKTPKVKAREYYRDQRDDRDYDDEGAYKKRHKREYASKQVAPAAKAESAANTELLSQKPKRKCFIPFIIATVPLLAFGLQNNNKWLILASCVTFAIGIARAFTSKSPAKPAAPVSKPAPVENNTISELRRLSYHIEDDALVANVQEIIKYTEQIEAALVKYPNAKKGELVQEYNAQLLNFLNLYNEAEDLRLSNKASVSMMENTRTYAADLVLMMRNVLEKIYETNVETADVNIEVMRKDMRMRGLMDEK